MKIVVFGATGRTGKEILKQAVAHGHSVTAFVRSPAAISPEPGTRVVEGDLFDSASVAAAIEGQSAVLSALGSRTLKNVPILAPAVSNILAAMRRHYVTRIIVLGAAGVDPGSGKYQNGLTNMAMFLIRLTVLRYPFADQAAQGRLLAASEMDYTIVRPPRLTDEPFTGRYRVLPDALPTGGLHVARADVAEFMLQQLTDPRFHRQGPYIAD